MTTPTGPAVDLCVLCVIEVAPTLALDPQLGHLGWAELGSQISPGSERETVVAFAGSEPVKGWAGHMEDLDDEDRADEWDAYRAETLMLAEVVIGAIAVFESRAGWDRALGCEEYLGYLHQRIGLRDGRESLSARLVDGVPLGALIPAAMDAGRASADESRARHDAASRPWPPPVPGMPPPGRGTAR